MPRLSRRQLFLNKLRAAALLIVIIVIVKIERSNKDLVLLFVTCEGLATPILEAWSAFFA